MSLSENDMMLIDKLKREGLGAFEWFFGTMKRDWVIPAKEQECREIFLRNVVITGGFFSSLARGEVYKDIDIFILDDFFQELLASNNQWPKMFFVDRKLSDGSPFFEMGKGHRYALHDNLKTVMNVVDSVFQIMMTKYKTREDVIADFDFKHCTISWYNGKLYLTPVALNAAKKKILIPNKVEYVTQKRTSYFKSKGYVPIEEIQKKLEREKLVQIIAQKPSTIKLIKPKKLLTPEEQEELDWLEDLVEDQSPFKVESKPKRVLTPEEQEELDWLEDLVEDQSPFKVEPKPAYPSTSISSKDREAYRKLEKTLDEELIRQDTYSTVNRQAVQTVLTAESFQKMLKVVQDALNDYNS